MQPTPWNWQQPDWPHFRYTPESLQLAEQRFLQSAWQWQGIVKHLHTPTHETLLIELLSQEAETSFAIEGEHLHRESLQSSLRKHMGLPYQHMKQHPKEYGVAKMMLQLYQDVETPLTHETLFAWHQLVMNERHDIEQVGGYRQHTEPMQIVSGYSHAPKVHYEAPPAQHLHHEMERFIQWFNQSSPQGTHPLPALERASVAHWYFLAIHPFEDGNGRLARGLVMKSLSQSVGQPLLLAVSKVIESQKKAYYEALAKHNKSNQLDAWLAYFSKVILEAQAYTHARVALCLKEACLLEAHRTQLNDRQTKVLHRLFQAGVEGFEGGLSAKNYMRLTDVSAATATRDLNVLVSLGILQKTGELKATRYWLV